MENQKILRAKLIENIQQAYAMETQVAQILQRQLAAITDQPAVRERLEQHYVETEQQRLRMARRLEAHGEDPSLVMSAASMLLGNVEGLTGVLRLDAVSHGLASDYATEHMEIATYTVLMAIAQAFGDHLTVEAARTSRDEELAMAKWIFERLEIAVFADLQKQGIEVDDELIWSAKKGHAFHVTFAPEDVAPAHTHAGKALGANAKEKEAHEGPVPHTHSEPSKPNDFQGHAHHKTHTRKTQKRTGK